ncbi:hypothetical protein ACEV93_25400, partial [Vibrio parahaemolyticus]
AALTAALFGRALARGVATRAESVAVAIGLGVLAADRPPYVFLLLLPLALRRGWRVALGGLSIVLAWLALNWPYRTITPEGVDAGRQALRLL